MFDIGFSELLVILVVGLVVLGPARLPVAVRTVASWIRTLRSLATSVQNELSQELKLQELQDSLKKAEQSGLQNLTPELKASMDELKEAAKLMQRNYHSEITKHHEIDSPQEPETIHQVAGLKIHLDGQTEPKKEDEMSSSTSESEAVTTPQRPATPVNEFSTAPLSQPTLSDSVKHGR